MTKVSFDARLERRYRRLGARYLLLPAGFQWAAAMLLLVLGTRLMWPYLGPAPVKHSLNYLAAMMVIDVTVVLALTHTMVFLRVRPLVAWMRGGRGDREFTLAAHRAALRLPWITAALGPIFVAVVNVPWIIWAVPWFGIHGSVVLIFLFAAVLTLYLALLNLVAQEAALRPVRVELSRELDNQAGPRPVRIAIGLKLLISLSATAFLGTMFGSLLVTHAHGPDATLTAILAGAGLAVLVLLPIALLSSWAITRPLHDLVAATERVATGDFSARVPPISQDEQEVLAVHFNEMVASLQRLNTERQTQMIALRESRQRIVEAGDSERKRIERDLHDGAQQRLVGIAMALRMAQRHVEDPEQTHRVLEAAITESQHALEELRELARGLHPQILSEQGLAAALESLAERCPLPVEVRVNLNGGIPDQAAACVYFMCSEALQNAVKHAQAKHAIIAATDDEEILSIEVSDDGVGGAHISAGSGLLGLRDRAEALGGTLELDSPAGGGTRVSARVPIAPTTHPQAGTEPHI